MTDLEKRVVEIIKKNHIQYRMWSDGNVLALREAIDFLELVDEHTAVAFQKVKRLLGEIEELKQRLISKDEDCKLWRERADLGNERGTSLKGREDMTYTFENGKKYVDPKDDRINSLEAQVAELQKQNTIARDALKKIHRWCFDKESFKIVESALYPTKEREKANELSK